MKRVYFLGSIAFFSFMLINAICAQEKGTSGMESIELGPGVSVLAPQGAKIEKSKGVITLEEPNAYLSRRFSEFEERLNRLEEKEQKLDEQLIQVKEILGKIKEDLKAKDKE